MKQKQLCPSRKQKQSSLLLIQKQLCLSRKQKQLTISLKPKQSKLLPKQKQKKSIVEAEAEKSIVETEAEKNIVETEAVETIFKTVAVEYITETEALEIIAETEAEKSIDETETAKNVGEIEAIESIARTVEAEAAIQINSSPMNTQNCNEKTNASIQNMLDECNSTQTDNVPCTTQDSFEITDADIKVYPDSISILYSISDNTQHPNEVIINSKLEKMYDKCEALPMNSKVENKEIPSLSSGISLSSNSDVIDQETIVVNEFKSMVYEGSSSEDNKQNQNMETSLLSDIDYCKILIKEVTEDNFEDDSEVEITDEPCSESRNTIPDTAKNITSSADESQVQIDKASSAINDIDADFMMDNDNNVSYKEDETVESIAESLYKKVLKAKEEKTSRKSCVSENIASEILTKNTVNYVMDKVIRKVECVDNLAKDQSFEELESIKRDIKFKPEPSQLPKLGNLSNLKPFGFPNEKSGCLSFVDVLQEKYCESKEIEDSQSNTHSPAKRTNFYPYRNLLGIEVSDDKSESNFSDTFPNDKLDYTICVSDESTSGDSDDEMTETNDFYESPSCSREKVTVENSEIIENVQSEAIIDEPVKPKVSKNNKQKLNVHSSNFSPMISSAESEIANAETLDGTIEGSRRDSEELISLVQTVTVPVVNLGSRCDEENFKNQNEDDLHDSENDKDVTNYSVSDKSKDAICPTETSKDSEKQNKVVAIKRLSPTNNKTSLHNQESKETVSGAKLDAVTTRRLRRRNVSATETDESEIAKQIHQTPERSRSTRLKTKSSTQKTLQSTESESAASSTVVSSRHSSKRLKKDINIKLRDEFNELRLDSPRAKRRNPIISKAEVDVENISGDSDANVEPSKVEKRTTRSSVANSKSCPNTKAELDHCDLSVDDGPEESCSDKKESMRGNPNVMRRTKCSVSSKITKYFPSKSKLELAPATEKEDEVASSVESSTENLTVNKRSTRSSSLITVLEDSNPKTELETFPIDEEETEDTKAHSNKVKSPKGNEITVRRSTRATSVNSEKGGSYKPKLSQIPIHEFGEEDADTRSTVSEESLKENVTMEEDKDYCTKSKNVKSSARAYNLRSKRILIRPSKLNILKKTEDNHS